MGGLFVADLFQLLLPGIDLNDPTKTSLSCMAISNMVDFIRLGDVSDKDGAADREIGTRAQRRIEQPRAEDDVDDPVQGNMEDLSAVEINERLRFGTMAWATWVEEFVGRVLLLFSNLPEEGGKSGKAGGRSEQVTLASVIVSSLLNLGSQADRAVYLRRRVFRTGRQAIRPDPRPDRWLRHDHHPGQRGRRRGRSRSEPGCARCNKSLGQALPHRQAENHERAQIRRIEHQNEYDKHSPALGCGIALVAKHPVWYARRR